MRVPGGVALSLSVAIDVGARFIAPMRVVAMAMRGPALWRCHRRAAIEDRPYVVVVGVGWADGMDGRFAATKPDSSGAAE